MLATEGLDGGATESTPEAAAVPSARRNVAVRLRPTVERQVRGGHPWVYAEAIASQSHAGATGDFAVLFDGKKRFLALGLYDAESPIRIRILHVGKSRPIDLGFWTERFLAALDRRSSLTSEAGTTGYRCVAGENDGLPGLVLDRYDGTLVLKLYTAAWLPHLPVLTQAIRDVFAPERLVLRLARTATAAAEAAGLRDGSVLHGPPVDGPVRFREAGLWFQADVVRGQKTGHFLDQRDNRRRVGQWACGLRVLDVFSCSGGFAVHAAAGGAREVHVIDVSPGAIATAEANMALNRGLEAVRACRLTATTGDAFEVLRQVAARQERYNLVVLDPPALGATAAQVPRALDAHARLTAAGCRVTVPGGLLVHCSCTARISLAEFVAHTISAARQAGYRLVELERTEHAVDHPIGFPEGAYLKALYCRVHPLAGG